ncbi:hypothetical protein [Sphingomonas nostoxanthinifaciens]|uniref:hypothetical protein n=1 Tax=Sphingomonas nostoxanthinifaciens TaxID=2872652 RepID=UPI001CC1CA38|nr:hypothetical protein [Sphingomonas nostoxanthinifaciens]UAK25551.1 hypothetical protein K8P63_05160 [Sphingomonas nostoxanthinifaciens]
MAHQSIMIAALATVAATSFPVGDRRIAIGSGDDRQGHEASMGAVISQATWIAGMTTIKKGNCCGVRCRAL